VQEVTQQTVRRITVSPRDIHRGALSRIGRFLREIAGVPLLVMLGFAVLAAVCLVGDQTTSVGFLNRIRALAGQVVGPDAATAALQGIATGLVTVTSITFSVLLLAVQQTASNLSPVVFDQFVRRKSNQAFLGFFVGLALFAYVVMAAVQKDTPPILGATVATGMTVVALVILLVLVHSTVAQMRPTSVIRVIHDRALAARAEEAELVARTLRASRSEHAVAVLARADTTGYVTRVDADVLARAVRDAADAEVCLHVTTGDHLCVGDVVVSVRADDPDRAEELATAVAAALTISKQRDLAHDPTTGVDELGNIAWSSGSTSKQNPEVARQALHALEDLTARWLSEEPPECSTPLPVVYRDNDTDRLVDVLYSLLVVAQESHQELFGAAVLDAYTHLLDRAPALRQRWREDLAAIDDLVEHMPPSRRLRTAHEAFRRALEHSPTGVLATVAI
jgi:uncharacterized membrane protein